MANNPTANQCPPTPPGDITAFLRADASASAADGGADPGAPPARDGVIQDMQRSLVERIADVDDDRRRTATQLQKALNAHRDQTDAALRHLRNLLSAVLALWVLLFAAGLIGLAWQSERRERALTAALAGLETRVAALVDLDARVAALAADTAAGAAARAGEQAMLADLGARLEQVTTLTGELAGELAGEPAGEPAGGLADERADAVAGRGGFDPAVVTALIDERLAPWRARLEAAATSGAPDGAPDGLGDGASASAPDLPSRAELTALAGELAALRDELRAGSGSAPPDPALVAATAAALEPGLREAAASAAREALAAELAARDAASVPIGMPIDELIDQQVSRLERDYQRLAQSVDSPALVPPPAAPIDRATDGATDPTTAGGEPGRLIVSESLGAGAADGAAAPAAEPAAADGAADADQPPTMRVGARGYALQLIGFHTRAELDAFRAAHALPAETYTREEQFRGRPWHVLIHSLYPDLTSATAALGQLPPDLGRLDVWVRNLPPDAVLEVLSGP